MPWEGVTVSEQRRNFIRDYTGGRYSKTELAERFGISRKTAHKWIDRFKEQGLKGLEELSRRPHSCPWQTDKRIVEDLVALRNVGLEEVDDGIYDLYFCFYQIGRYDLRTNRIEDIISKVPTSQTRAELTPRVSPMSLE